MDAKLLMDMEDAIEEVIDLLFNSSYEKLCDLSCTAYVTKEPLPFAKKTEGTKIELPINGKWAEDVFDCAWFHVTGEIPSGYADGELVFIINCGGEGLVYDRDGVEKQAITCFASDFDWQLGAPVKKVVLTDGLVHDGKADFWIDCAANDLFGKMKNESRMTHLCVSRPNLEVRALAYDVETLYSVYEYTSDKEFGDTIFNILAEVCGECDDDIDDVKAAGLRSRLAPLLATKNTGDAFNYTAIGHAHLDLAWLWPIRESYRKAARTFSTQFMNIKKYPNFIFGASQAQLYQWVKDLYPRIYSQVKALVAEGKNWEVQGATWVEMDSNLISGESMIRQFFYGKKFYREEFGLEMEIFWVPDSFGYSACIPQVMKLADVPYFLTQKMSWNTVNKFPYHSFYWQGLDGSRVLAHMLPEETYNSPINANYMAKGENNYQERAISDKAMILFGIGDGGAGPGFEHLERMKRLEDIKGLPRVKPGKAIDFFREFDDGKTPYPTHSGELYLEKHQGTYTTRAKNKKFNRKCEFALRNYEMLAAMAFDRNITPPIGKDALDTIWKEILLYQFHDILPGSSINRVYDESGARYDTIYAELTGAIKTLLDALVNAKSVVNLNSFAYSKNISVDGVWYGFEIPAFGFARVAEAKELTQFYAKADDNSIENDKIRVVFENGLIVSLYDKTLEKELVMPGQKMSVISGYEDKGDCWDIAPVDYSAAKKDAECTSFKTGVNGAEAYAEAEYKIGETTITQRFSIIDGSNLLSADMDIDCHQESSMLRIAFPTSVQTDECTFNIQFGHLARKTTNSNSVEQAQFEVSGQKFVDMSQETYGLSFINDCKYGYKCKEGIIDLDLVRSPKGGPGINVDQGSHHVKYALFPHAGQLGIDTYKEAYLLNNPLYIVGEGNEAGCSGSIYTSSNPSIILETIKIPEDKNGIIVRFYNASAKNQETAVSIKGYRPAEVVGIMENRISEKTDDNISLHGFELVNIRYVKSN